MLHSIQRRAPYGKGGVLRRIQRRAPFALEARSVTPPNQQHTFILPAAQRVIPIHSACRFRSTAEKEFPWIYQKFFFCGWYEGNWTEEEMVLLTIVLRPTGHTLINSFIMSDLSDVRFRSRNRPPLSDFVRIIRITKISDKFMGIHDNFCWRKKLQAVVFVV